MKIETMEDLFLEQIEDLYDAEQVRCEVLPRHSACGTGSVGRRDLERGEGQTRSLPSWLRTK